MSQESIYDYVVYDSEIEREFAKQLDARDDIKLFVKLPRHAVPFSVVVTAQQV